MAGRIDFAVSPVTSAIGLIRSGKLVPLETALHSIVDWYEAFSAGADMRRATLAQLRALSGAQA